jgi:hypothetical protein
MKNDREEQEKERRLKAGKEEQQNPRQESRSKEGKGTERRRGRTGDSSDDGEKSRNETTEGTLKGKHSGSEKEQRGAGTGTRREHVEVEEH